jgi:ATP-dependent DNA ligase
MMAIVSNTMHVVNGQFEFEQLSSGGRTWQAFVKSDEPIDLTDIKSNKSAYIYTVYGVANKVISSDTIVKGKNIGKSNETTNLEQAISQVTSMIKKKKQTGYSNEEQLFPMAVSPWHGRKVNWPVMLQPKLDGVRLLASRESLSTRRLHDVEGFGFIKTETDEFINIIETCAAVVSQNIEVHFIDGELYKHGMHLQDISGIVRSFEHSQKESLEYHVFDMCCTPNLNFMMRNTILGMAFGIKQFTYLRNLETVLAQDGGHADMYFDRVTSEGYEGIIYKPVNSEYESSTKKEKRSTKYLKRKVQHDAEFKIIGYSEGNGKFKGLVIFKLETEDGKSFDCVPIGTAEYRSQLFTQCQNAFSDLKDKLAKVRFDDLSKDGIPTRAVIVQVGRDMSFD